MGLFLKRNGKLDVKKGAKKELRPNHRCRWFFFCIRIVWINWWIENAKIWSRLRSRPIIPAIVLQGKLFFFFVSYFFDVATHPCLVALDLSLEMSTNPLKLRTWSERPREYFYLVWCEGSSGTVLSIFREAYVWVRPCHDLKNGCCLTSLFFFSHFSQLFYGEIWDRNHFTEVILLLILLAYDI